MNAWRLAELRQCLLFVKEARLSLASKDLRHAFRWYGLALRGLSVLRGMACKPGGDPCATAGLARIVSNLGDAIEEALTPAQFVEAADLVLYVFESLTILQKRGVDVSDDLLWDRARNSLDALRLHVRFVAIEPAPR